jgi:hypothetical protein
MRHLLTAGAAAAALAFGGSAQAAVVYFANLNGANENPVVVTPATGTAYVTVDAVTNMMTVDVTFTGLTAAANASHIHCCLAPPTNAGVATAVPTFPGFPTATSGTYHQTFDLLSASTYNPAFVSANGGTAASAESVLLAGLVAGNAYLNIHDANHPGGEIQGYLIPVPEPGSWALLITGFGMLGATLRRRRHQLAVA